MFHHMIGCNMHVVMNCVVIQCITNTRGNELCSSRARAINTRDIGNNSHVIRILSFSHRNIFIIANGAYH